MFVEALDMVLGQMRDADFNFSSVSVASTPAQLINSGRFVWHCHPLSRSNDHHRNALWNEGALFCC